MHIAKIIHSLIIGFTIQTTKLSAAVHILTEQTLMTDHLPNALAEDYPESPRRIQYPYKILKEASYTFTQPIPAKLEWLLLAHDQRYLSDIKSKMQQPISGNTFLFQNPDLPISSGSWKASLQAAGAAVHAVQLVAPKKSEKAFVLARPPGHHATRNQAMGFCFLNNIAIAAKYALKYHTHIKKILIVDWDLHHGNGTQEIVSDDPRIFFASVHLSGIFPGGKNMDLNQSNIQNTSISKSLNLEERRDLVFSSFNKLATRMKTFKPDLILISAGFDGHREEIIEPGGLGLKTADFEKLTHLVRMMAIKNDHDRVISILEGGYHIGAITESIQAHLRGMSESYPFPQPTNL